MNQPAPTKAYRYYVLAILVVVYTLNFLDRTGDLNPRRIKIKKEFDLTDSQLGLMSGLAFSVLYSTLGIPIAWLADRGSRIRIMAWALGSGAPHQALLDSRRASCSSSSRASASGSANRWSGARILGDRRLFPEGAAHFERFQYYSLESRSAAHAASCSAA